MHCSENASDRLIAGSLRVLAHRVAKLADNFAGVLNARLSATKEVGFTCSIHSVLPGI